MGGTGNLLTQNPNTGSVLRHSERLDFRVVVEQFFTDTALEADIVLPAKNMFEQSDIIGSYWNPYIQLKQKVKLNPQERWKPETEIYWLLAKQLGFNENTLKNILLPPGNDEVEILAQKLQISRIIIRVTENGSSCSPGHQEIASPIFLLRPRRVN